MKSLIIILIGLVGSWFLTDVRSDSGVFNLLMPVLCVMFAVALLIWLAFALAAKRINDRGPAELPDISVHRSKTQE
ncbi:MAG TPA: hypothetical protein VIC08_09790 [Cellvibrionaceae bacterium]